MQPTDDFLTQAQACIDDVFRSRRSQVLAAYGNIAVDLKSDNTPVTELDKQFEAELREALAKFDSGIGFVGEELGKEGDEDTFWLIDPIDGTESFVRGIPFMRHIVTLISGGRPVYTYIYKPITEDLFTAIEGRGAFKNGTRLSVSNRPLNRCWLELSVRHRDSSVWPMLAAVEKVIAAYRIIGDFPSVAEGKVDGHLAYKSDGGDWDYAPRALLMQEAGAKVSNIGSDSYDYRNHDFLAINPQAFDELMPLIVRSLKEGWKA